MDFSTKFRIFTICTIFYIIQQIIVSLLVQIFDDVSIGLIFLTWIAHLSYLIVWGWFIIVVYKDAKTRELTENWFFIIFFMSFLGAIIYYCYVKGKPKIEAQAKIPDKKVKKLELACPDCWKHFTIKETEEIPIPLKCPACRIKGEFPLLQPLQDLGT